MKIDIAAHITPPAFKKRIIKKLPKNFTQSFWYKYLVLDVNPSLSDLESRFRIMDQYDGVTQVLTLASPPIETLLEPEDAVELSRIANDELAELVIKYPDRFVAAVACLPMNAIDHALDELERSVNALGMKGIQLFTSINGKPLDLMEYVPFFDKMAYYDLPIWLHPVRERKGPDYPTEKESKYLISSLFGREYETSAGMTRLIFSGIFDKNPGLKIITHHFGGMVSFLEERIEAKNITRPPIEYFQMFYCDTAYGNSPGLKCAHSFFGPGKILFGTDMPYDSEFGSKKIRKTIKSIEQMDVSDEDKKKIFNKNALGLLRLKN
jgi:aminocarboxymuconate-semialdehyde decarboxylase